MFSFIAGWRASRRGNGDVLVDSGANATITGVTLQNGNATAGGGINNSGKLVVADCTISGNVLSTSSAAEGGGIYSAGITDVTNSTITGNTSKKGGGIFQEFAYLSVTDSTLDANTATVAGTQVNTNSPFSVFNGTIIAGGAGGSTVDIKTPTSLTLGGTDDLIDDNSGTFASTTGIHHSVSAGLGTFGYHGAGATTESFALATGSPAIGNGGYFDSINTDQGGQLRPQSAVDIGAYQTQSTPSAPTGLAASALDSQASLSWTAATGAVAYNVYKDVSGSYTPIGSTASTSYTVTGLTDSTSYSFKVSAYAGGGESSLSSSTSVTPVAGYVGGAASLVSFPSLVSYTSDATCTLSGTPGAYTLTLTGGSWTFSGDISAAGTDWQNLNLIVSGPASVVFDARETLDTLTLAADSHVRLGVSEPANGTYGNLLQIDGDGSSDGLLIDPTARLDAGNNDIIVQNAASDIGTFNTLLTSGCHESSSTNLPGWDGPGINSSSAHTTIGGAETALYATLGTSLVGSTFDGASIAAGTMVIHYTLYADSNYDYNVDLTDYRAFKAAYGTSIGDSSFNPVFDVNRDGNIDLNDYRVFKATYGQSLQTLSTPRTLNVTGLTVTLTEGGDVSGIVADFTDTLATSASYYNVYVDFGNGVFVPEEVTTLGSGEYGINVVTPVQITNTHALMTALVEYSASATGVYVNDWPASLSSPINAIPAVQDLAAVGASSSSIALSWTAGTPLDTGAGDHYIVERSTNGTTFTNVPTGSSPITTTSFADTGLTGGTTYYYQVYAVIGTFQSANSNIASTTPLALAPTSPSATAMDTQALLTWTAATGATSYNIYQENGSSVFVNIGSTDSTNYVVTGLTNGTTYYYKVSSVTDGGESALTSSVSVTPAAQTVEFLTATPASTTEIDLAWNLNDITATSMEVDRSTNGTTWTAATTTLPGTATSFADTGLTENTQYYYRVRAFYGGSTYSSYSLIATASTLPAISGLTATAPTTDAADKVSLNWTDNSVAATVTGINVGVYETSTGAFVANYSTVATATSYTVPALAESQGYTFDVNYVTSGASEEAASTTATTAAAVDSVTATSAATNSITVTWNANVSAVSAFEVDRSSDDGTTFTALTTTLSPTLGTYTNTGLADNFNYTYRVRAIYASGYSAWSESASATTLENAGSLTATTISTGSVQLGWTINNTGVTTIALFRSVDGGDSEYLPASISPTAVSYTDNTVSEGHTYTYELQTIASGTVGNFSNPASASTLPIQNVSYTPTTTGMELAWSNYSTDPSTTTISVLRAAGTSTSFTTAVSGLSGTTTGWADSGLTANSEYSYQIVIDEAGTTTNSGTIDTWTLPLAPTSVTAANATPTEVDLTWSIPTGSGSVPYSIARSEDGGTTYGTIGQTLPGATSYSDTTVADGASYQYQVTAMSGDGYNQSAPATSAAVAVPLIAPTDLTLSVDGQNEIDLSWNNTSASATGYNIYRSTNGAAVTLSDLVATVDDPDATAYSDSALTAGTQYSYYVCAIGASGGPSAPSNAVTAATAPMICQPTVTPTGTEGSPITLTTSVTYAAGEVDPITGWIIQWGDGSTTSTVATDPDPRSFQHTYNATGTYTITASTADGSFSGTATTTIDYTAGSLSTTNNSVSGSIAAGASYNIQATLTDPSGNSVTKWLVDWGDGSVSTAAGSGDTLNISHAYAYAGVYGQTVVAVTNDGVYERGAGPTYGLDVTGTYAGAGTGISIRNSPTEDSDTLIGSEGADMLMQFDDPGSGSSSVDYTINWGDGQSQTVTATPGGWSAEFSHNYAHASFYTVTVTGDDDGGTAATIIQQTLPTIAALPEQVVSPGQTVSTTFSDIANDVNAVAYVNWNDGTGPHPATVTTNSTGGTITATVPPTLAPGSYSASFSLSPLGASQASPPVYQGDSIGGATMTFSLGVCGLVIGGNSAVATSSDATPPNVFIPLDDELSADGVTPENELSTPDSTDQRLVSGDLTYFDCSAWTLTFPSNVHVFAEVDDALVPITSGTANSVSTTGTEEDVSLEVQGISAVTAAEIQVAFTSPTSAPATQKVNANVASVINPEAVAENVAGDELTGTAKQAGIFVPYMEHSAGYTYLAPFILHVPADSAHRALQLIYPNTIHVYYGESGVPGAEVGNQKPFVPVNGGSITETFYIGADHAGVGVIQVKWAGARATDPELDHFPIDAFFVKGATDVPQFGTYEYTVPTPPQTGSRWIQSSGGTLTMAVPAAGKQPNLSDAFVGWGAGPVIGTIEYGASTNFSWDLQVNVAKVTVGTPEDAFKPGTPFQQDTTRIAPNTIVVKSGDPGLSWRASVTFDSPGGNASISHLAASFIQNAFVKQFSATYGGTNTLAVATENRTSIVGKKYFDNDGNDTKFYTSKTAHSESYYTGKTQATGKGTNVISANDTPKGGEPVFIAGGLQVNAMSLLWNFDLFVAATTDEGPASYAAQAVANWSFDAGGKINPGKAWTSTTAKVTPPAAWMPLTETSQQPVLDTELFNVVLNKIRFV